MIVLRGGTVVDVEGTRTADVAVEDGEITAVESSIDADPEQELDASGRFVAPGLIDSHVHLMLDARPDPSSLRDDSEAMLAYRAASQLRDLIRAGVTTVRDLGATGSLAIDADRAVRTGLLAGPRVVAAGATITMTGGHGHTIGGREVDGPDEARKAAREQLKRGASVLKCMATGGVMTAGSRIGEPELFEDELRAVVAVGERAGVPVAAHAHGTEGIKDAVRAGVDSIEHGTFMDAEAAELMAERGTYWVPTTRAPVRIAEGGVEGGIPEEAVTKNETAVEAHVRAFDHALSAGVPIAMGTDAGTPFNDHAGAAAELELMVERGVTPERALSAATVDAADLLDLDDVGRVEPGHRADLVVLDANPLDDASAWQRPRAVVAGGDVVRA